MSAALGRRLRDSGIQAVLELEGEWKERYRAQLIHWFERRLRGHLFTGETLRFVAIERGVGEPHHHCAWGGASNSLIGTWLRSGQIEVVALVPAESAKTHAHLLRQYRKVR